jgi:hypothetical protein
MGLNLQSDEFWGLRPDNFMIMSDAFEDNQALKWAMVRKAGYFSLLSRDGIDVKELDEMSLFSIPRIDNTVPRKKEKVFRLTDEQKEQGKKIYEQHLKEKNGSSD